MGKKSRRQRTKDPLTGLRKAVKDAAVEEAKVALATLFREQEKKHELAMQDQEEKHKLAMREQEAMQEQG